MFYDFDDTNINRMHIKYTVQTCLFKGAIMTTPEREMKN